MRRLLQPRLHSLCFGLALATAASHAYAQSDPGAARSLFDEGRKLLAEGKYSAACPKLEESQKLDPGMGTLFNLADCWEHIGRTASAWARFREVAEAASRSGQHDREKIARARVAALDAKLSRLIVEVRASDQGLELKKDGVPFGAAQWGSALPTDAGDPRHRGPRALEATLEDEHRGDRQRQDGDRRRSPAGERTPFRRCCGNGQRRRSHTRRDETVRCPVVE